MVFQYHQWSINSIAMVDKSCFNGTKSEHLFMTFQQLTVNQHEQLLFTSITYVLLVSSPDPILSRGEMVW